MSLGKVVDSIDFEPAKVVVQSPTTITLADYIEAPWTVKLSQKEKKTSLKPKGLNLKSAFSLGHVDHISKEDSEIDAVQTDGPWEVIKCKLDSGACETVFKPDVARAFPLIETEASKNGLNFSAANGTEIKNYGKRDIKGYTGDWCPIEQSVQIAEVKRNLASAIKIVKAGNRIVLDDEGSFIEDKKTGRQIKVKMGEAGEFEFDLWVPKAGALKNSEVDTTKKGKKKVSFEHKNKFGELANEMEVDNDEEEGDNMLQMVFMRQV